MFAGLKRFDIHTKAIEGVNQQTILGALLTIVTSVLVLILLISEVSNFLEVDVVSRMAVDPKTGIEAINVEFDMVFHQIRCDRFSFVQEITRGTIHVHEPIAVNMEAHNNNEGCRVAGHFLTDKVTGNFRFNVLPKDKTPPGDGTERPVDYDLTHSINRLEMLPTTGKLANDKLPQISTNILRSFVHVNPGSTIFQYAIQVVPTEYKTLYGELSFLNQYTVNEKIVDNDQLARAEVLSGINIRDFHGLLFTYEFSPVMLYMEERRERIVDFVSNLVGIVGGVITVLGIVEGVLHHSAKALIGKKD